METNYEIIGSGKKTIVFIHYFGGDAGSWKWLAKRLKRNHRCILLNLPGFGDTPPLKELSIYDFSNYIIQCIEELKLKNYTLCGHSMGAKLALYASKLMMDNRPNKIILIAPSPPTTESMSNDEKKRMLNHPNKEEASATVAGATVKRLREKRYIYAVESQLRIDEKTWDWWLLQGMENNIANRIQDLELPTFIIFSKNDPVIDSDSIYKEVLPYMQNPSVITLGNVGHLIPMEAPRKLARQIKRITKIK
ncbi:MAG: alpha/beta hydrolase [Maribacter sp.]